MAINNFLESVKIYGDAKGKQKIIDHANSLFEKGIITAGERAEYIRTGVMPTERVVGQKESGRFTSPTFEQPIGPAPLQPSEVETTPLPSFLRGSELEQAGATGARLINKEPDIAQIYQGRIESSKPIMQDIVEPISAMQGYYFTKDPKTGEYVNTGQPTGTNQNKYIGDKTTTVKYDVSGTRKGGSGGKTVEEMTLKDLDELINEMTVAGEEISPKVYELRNQRLKEAGRKTESPSPSKTERESAIEYLNSIGAKVDDANIEWAKKKLKKKKQ